MPDRLRPPPGLHGPDPRSPPHFSSCRPFWTAGHLWPASADSSSSTNLRVRTGQRSRPPICKEKASESDSLSVWSRRLANSQIILLQLFLIVTTYDDDEVLSFYFRPPAGRQQRRIVHAPPAGYSADLRSSRKLGSELDEHERRAIRAYLKIMC